MKQRILVDLDAILDTRLGTLMRMGVGEKALALNYRQRKSDRWAEMGLDVDQVEYDRLYAERDIYTLAASRPTNISYLLNQITEYLSRLRLNAPMYDTCEVIVNLYPYQLDKDVQDEIVVAVSSWVSMDSTITTAYRAPKDITPNWLSGQAEGYVVYDFDGWLTHHGEAFKSCRIPRNSVIAPSLYWNETPENESVEVDGVGQISPFAAVEVALLEYVSVNFQKPEHFSLITF